VTAAARVVYYDEQLEWAPLEQAMQATRPVDRDIVVGDFMWMGAVDLVDGRRLHLYKHTDTRRYLRLDSEGTCIRARCRRLPTPCGDGRCDRRPSTAEAV